VGQRREARDHFVERRPRAELVHRLRAIEGTSKAASGRPCASSIEAAFTLQVNGL
jgi:hypothetical protein